MNSGFVEPAWLHASDTFGPRAFPASTSQPWLPDTTTHDGEQNQHSLQEVEQDSGDGQIEEEDCVLDGQSTSSKSDQHVVSSPSANVSSLQCEHCKREFSTRGLLNKHIKTHTRPIKRPMPKSNDALNPEASKAPSSSGSYNFCPYERCKHSEARAERPMRQDDLRRHIRTKHRLEQSGLRPPGLFNF